MTAWIIRRRDLARLPWKNGGGTTSELAAFPAGAGFEDFAWRISMAEVATDGPFSTFPGVDRTLVLIEGQGAELTVGGVPHRLDAASPSLRFAGESVTTARLADGPIRDLNVMTRRARFAHAVELLAPGTTKLSVQAGDTIALLALNGIGKIETDRETLWLDRFDMLVADRAPSRVVAEHPVLLIRLWAARQ